MLKQANMLGIMRGMDYLITQEKKILNMYLNDLTIYKFLFVFVLNKKIILKKLISYSSFKNINTYHILINMMHLIFIFN